MNTRFYVTTPIYYVNDVPHIGHSYTSVLGDVLARWHRLLGHEVFFLTGTDEHGQKVQEAAQKAGRTPKEHVDATSERFREMGRLLGLSNDRFIRTTDPDHVSYVQDVLQKLWDKGEIYKSAYKGLYNVRDERFYSESDIREGRGPGPDEVVEEVEEVNYFFKMGSYQEKLLEQIQQNPDWIVPDFRRNEVSGFLRQPLGDLCISRPKSRLSWGIELPFDREFVTYVWFDALLNYVTGPIPTPPAEGERWWPASVHLIGKDILTTHSVYWPTMLMGAGIPLPRQILAHGWWMADGQKMSKSLGNVVDPFDVAAKYADFGGAEAFRFFLMREMVVGQDSSYSDAGMTKVINNDLANDVGNILSRIRKQVATGFDGVLPALPTELSGASSELRDKAVSVVAEVENQMRLFRVSHALEETMSLARAINSYLESTAPWKLAKDPARRDELAEVLAVSSEALRVLLVLLSPYMPRKIAEALRLMGGEEALPGKLAWGLLPSGRAFQDGAPLFPRLMPPKDPAQSANPGKQPKVHAAPPAAEPNHPFGKVDYRVAKVVSAEDHPGAEKLLVLQLDVGEAGQRQVCAGIRSQYSAESMVGRKLLLVANLKKAKLRGVESQGMILAADDPEGRIHLLSPEGEPGSFAVVEGLDRMPGQNLLIDTLDAFELSISGGRLVLDGKPVLAGGVGILCQAPDGAKAH
ncbi:MAG: methionine--tRNA ligase [Fibrobacteria bacterium]|nr:methionine--tRNA ligase [Fibrobacteria bacterium]